MWVPTAWDMGHIQLFCRPGCYYVFLTATDWGYVLWWPCLSVTEGKDILTATMKMRFWLGLLVAVVFFLSWQSLLGATLMQFCILAVVAVCVPVAHFRCHTTIVVQSNCSCGLVCSWEPISVVTYCCGHVYLKLWAGVFLMTGHIHLWSCPSAAVAVYPWWPLSDTIFCCGPVVLQPSPCVFLADNGRNHIMPQTIVTKSTCSCSLDSTLQKLWTNNRII